MRSIATTEGTTETTPTSTEDTNGDGVVEELDTQTTRMARNGTCVT